MRTRHYPMSCCGLTEISDFWPTYVEMNSCNPGAIFRKRIAKYIVNKGRTQNHYIFSLIGLQSAYRFFKEMDIVHVHSFVNPDSGNEMFLYVVPGEELHDKMQKYLKGVE